MPSDPLAEHGPSTERPAPAPDDPGFHVVGLGASAGGLEAPERFFDRVGPRSGMAFVVVQHLSPDFESRMDELLGRRTALPVRQAEDGLLVEPDHVYLLPPRKEMMLANGRLLLTDKDVERGFSLPIDDFFRSLAQDAGARAIAIVLSGSGSDGARGVRAVHAAGGLVLAQSEETARFESMPLGAQATGAVDLVLPPEAMPDALLEYVRERLSRDELSRRRLVPLDEEATQRILGLVRREHGIDFSAYKAATVERRIQRRLALHQVEDVERFAELVERDPTALSALYQDLLIGVTRFFRDQQAFAELERTVVPALVEHFRRDGEIRVWVPGCATGEEAYSLAMLLLEAASERGDLQVKVFGTDVHRPSLAVAAAGLYPEDALAELDPVRRDRWFARDRGGMQVLPGLRRAVVFAHHDVLADAPFTRLHLVSCRNLLIYLRPEAQRKALSLFHFGLKTGGYLFLGSSETVGDLDDEFDRVGSGRVFRKRRDVRIHVDRGGAGGAPRRRRLRAPPGERAAPGDGALLAVYDRLLERFAPPSLLVDGRFHLLHVFGDADRFVRVRRGRPSESVLELVSPELKSALSRALRHALKSGQPVRYGGVVTEAAPSGAVDLSVEPVPVHGWSEPCLLVRFEGVALPTARADVALDTEAVSQDYVRSLERDLEHTRENLQASVEELETANEELQAANEELVASNEELQSTNEELHSVNQELESVNGELEGKVRELTELTRDVEHLLHATQVALVFLDAERRIRKFTEDASLLFGFLPHDVGRPFEPFARAFGEVDLGAEVEDVLRNGDLVEREVQDDDGRPYLLRVLPYRTEGEVSGVLVMLIDIAPLRAAESSVRRLSHIVESVQEAIIGKDLDGRILSWNGGAERTYGWTAAEAIGRHVSLIVPDDRQDELRRLMRRIARGEYVPPFETRRVHKDGRHLHVSVSVSPVRDETGRLVGASAVGLDVTARLNAERRLPQALRQRDHFLATLSHELRNPLYAILNAAHLVAEEDVTPAGRRSAVAVIQRQGRRMSRLLEDLLDLSRFRRGGIRLSRRRIDLGTTMDQVLETVRPIVQREGVRLEVERPRAPLPLAADPDRLCQLQVNLLTNAVKFTPAGRGVRYSLGREGDEAVVRVRDEGVGIDAEALESIFDPFVQATDEDGEGEQGLGLGLAVVHSIVEAHGGSVSAASEGVGRGAEFVVRLPLLVADLAPAAEEESGEAGEPAAGARGATILLVEDQDDSRAMLKLLLEMKGYRVVAEADGPQALEALARHRPRVALIDLGLPSMDGKEVARRARETHSRHDLFLVALTGRGMPSDRREVVEAHFDRHLVKPVNLDVLLGVLREGLSTTGEVDEPR